MIKRFFDITVTAVGLIFASPFMAVIALLIKLESKGPVLYSCRRIGKDRKPFGMLKFRTMLSDADRVSRSLCPVGDVRVTPLGRFLRRTKLNELPQLFNVIAGQMSLVGPRPEDPEFLDDRPDQWEVVLSVRPGISGPNQIHYRNEEDLYPLDKDPREFYRNVILPEKLRRDIDYAMTHTLWGDISLLLKGVYSTVREAFTLGDLLGKRDAFLSLAADAALSIAAYMLANLLRYEHVPLDDAVAVGFPLVVVINTILFTAMGLYGRDVRFFSFTDLGHIVKLSVLAGAVFVLATYFRHPGSGHSRTVFVLYTLILAVLLSSRRMVERSVWEWRERLGNGSSEVERVVIYGAGRLGTEAGKRLDFEPGFQVVGFVDDDPRKKDRSVMGLRVLGQGRDLAFLKILYEIDKVVLAFKPKRYEDLVNAGELVNGCGIDEVAVYPPVLFSDGKALTAGALLPVLCPVGSVNEEKQLAAG
jgi:lipopolysaccharide/colanic/teichoic acid biosynthesis glycosyltransferase